MTTDDGGSFSLDVPLGCSFGMFFWNVPFLEILA